MSYSILVASIIPLLFLYLVKWLNFFETHKARLVVVALLWGGVSLWLSYTVDHSIRMALDAGELGKQIVSTHYAPVVEEIFKSLILLYLVRRADTTFFVDGAVYGFASGIGFAIAENMLYLSRVDAATGEIIGTTRAFVSSVMHGSTTAIVGMALAGFPMGGLNKHPVVAWVIGLAIAISLHMAYNNTAFHHFVFGQTGVVILAVFAFATLALVVLAILWGLRRERWRLRKSLGGKSGKTGLSRGEAMLVQHMDDLDDLLAPVEQRFGELKREQVANVLLLTAQLSMKQDLIRTTKDPELRVDVAAQITELKRDLKRQRGEVGMYVMSYVRSIMPKTTWSLWARVGQSLARLGPAKTNLWGLLKARLVGHNPSGESLQARIRRELDARANASSAALLATEGEE
jgi:RsiW-degrading membrane proteinase PrsW (M82 family)